MILYFFTRYFRISIAQAIRMIRPLMMYSILASTARKFSPVKMIYSSRTPTTIPLIRPIPPTKDTPPITQAAIASHS